MIDQGLMELEPCYGIDDCRKFLDTDGAHEQRGQPEQKAIERGQLRSALPESIADQHMMLEQQGLCSDGACPTGSKERRTSNDQVNDEDEQLAHGPNVTTIEHADKTARNGPCALNSKFTNSPPTGGGYGCVGQIGAGRVTSRVFAGVVRRLIAMAQRLTCAHREYLRTTIIPAPGSLNPARI